MAGIEILDDPSYETLPYGSHDATMQHEIADDGSDSASQKDNSRLHPRAVLSESQAIEIYQLRPKRSGKSKSYGNTIMLARKHSVSCKTIRDIWNRRTWIEHTRHLWTEDEKALVRKKKAAAPKLTQPQGPSFQSNLVAPSFIFFPAKEFSQINGAHLTTGASCPPPPILSNTTFALLSAFLNIRTAAA